MCRTVNLKSRCWAKVHCSIAQTMSSLTKQCDNLPYTSNSSFIKLTLALNQNCLNVNEQRLYNKLWCM